VTSPRPGAICRALLAALEASDGRRQRRQRDTTPDRIGLGIKQALLEQALADDPDPEAFEAWLVTECGRRAAREGEGAVRAMALEILHEVRLAERHHAFATWLAAGAPSADRP
jgi:hypothetical protein